MIFPARLEANEQKIRNSIYVLMLLAILITLYKFREIERDQIKAASGITETRQVITAKTYVTQQKCNIWINGISVGIDECAHLATGGEYVFIGKESLRNDTRGNPQKRLKVESYYQVNPPQFSGKLLFYTALNYCSQQSAVVRDAILNALGNTRGGLVIALVFGITQYLAWGVRQDFKTAGLQHMVAASGFNISLVVSTVRPLLIFFPEIIIKNTILLLCVWLYTYLAGAAAALLRATVMFTMTTVATIVWKRPNLPFYRLVTTAIILLLVDARYWENISFHLSFAAVASMMLFTTTIETQIQQFSQTLLHRALWFANAIPARLLPALLRNVATKCGNYLLETLVTTIAAQILTLPVLMHHFGEISAFSLFANVSILWLISPLTIVAGIYACAVGVHAPFVGLLAEVVRYGASLLLAVVGWWGEWRSSLLTFPTWNTAQLLGCEAGLLILAGILHRRRIAGSFQRNSREFFPKSRNCVIG